MMMMMMAKRARTHEDQEEQQTSSLAAEDASAAAAAAAVVVVEWYRPTDPVQPFSFTRFIRDPENIHRDHLQTISLHHQIAHLKSAQQDPRVVDFKTRFAVRYNGECLRQQRFWRAWDLFFSDFSLPKIPDMVSGTVGCYERHLSDPKSLVGVAGAVWEFLEPRCPHGVEIILCPPSPFADSGSLKNGAFYAYLTAEGDVISPDDPVGYICVLTC